MRIRYNLIGINKYKHVSIYCFIIKVDRFILV